MIGLLTYPPLFTLYSGLGMVFVLGCLIIYFAVRPL